MKNPAAEIAGRLICVMFIFWLSFPQSLKHSGVGNPAGKIPDKPTVGWPEVGTLSIGAAGMTEILTCGGDHSVS